MRDPRLLTEWTERTQLCFLHDDLPAVVDEYDEIVRIELEQFCGALRNCRLKLPRKTPVTKYVHRGNHYSNYVIR